MTKYIEIETPQPGFRPFITDDGVEIKTFEELPRDVSLKEIYELPGDEVPPHHHSWGQLLYSSEGVMQVIAEDSIWVIPPQRAVWIPPGVEHCIKALQAIRLRNVYVAPRAIEGMPDHCQVLHVTALLRELIAEAVRLPPLYDLEGPDGRLVNVLLDHLKMAKAAKLHVPMPWQGPLGEISRHLQENPGDDATLEIWADRLGTTSRTLARTFKKQTNMTFGQWRQQVRLLEALSRLAAGQSIAHIAQDLGYSSQSAFSVMFKKALGTSPGKYFD